MIVENYEKLFTKKESNNIIEKDYNPLNEEPIKSYEREGLCMEETKDIVLKEIKKQKLNLKERIIIKIFPNICIKLYRRGMINCFNYYNKDGTF